MPKLDSPTEVACSAIGSIFRFIALFFLAWMLGSALGAACHGAGTLSAIFVAAGLSFLVGPFNFGSLFFLNWLMAVLLGTGIWNDGPRPRIAILLLVFGLAAIAGYRSLMIWD